MKTKKVLSPEDWISAGFRALKERGAQGLNVEALARQLGVSKGSFYWHFKNAAALKAAMLDYWVEHATSSMIVGARNANQNPADQLRWLVAAIYKTTPNPMVSSDVDENTIRNLSRFDEQVYKTVQHVDALRLEFLENLFSQGSPHGASGRNKAVILYASFIGLEQLATTEKIGASHNLPKLLELLLAKDL
jgi:AcrR family transcriptional regulator